MEEAVENDLVDVEHTHPSDYFDNWDSFSQRTQEELEDLFLNAAEISEEEREEGYGREPSGTY